MCFNCLCLCGHETRLSSSQEKCGQWQERVQEDAQEVTPVQLWVLLIPTGQGSHAGKISPTNTLLLLLLLLSRFSCVRLCVTPETAAHQALPSLGFSRQEHWSGLPFPSPMQESEKWNWSHSVVSESSRPHGLQPTRLLHPWDFPGKSTGVGCHCLLRILR